MQKNVNVSITLKFYITGITTAQKDTYTLYGQEQKHFLTSCLSYVVTRVLLYIMVLKFKKAYVLLGLTSRNTTTSNIM